MGFEIERKFLVDLNNPELQKIMEQKPIEINQGYLVNTKESQTVFVNDDSLIINIPTNNIYFEFKIPFKDAHDIRTTFNSKQIQKSHLNNKNNVNPDWIFNDGLSVFRVRVADQKGFFTLKGKNNGISRPEFEFDIPYEKAMDLLNNCSDILTKNRFISPIENNLKFEIDQFTQINLCLAEIELPNKDTTFNKPAWLLEDVSDDSQYYNNNIIKLIAKKQRKIN